MFSKERHAILALLLLLFIDGMGQGLIFPILTNAIINPKSHAVLHLATQQERTIWYGVIVFSFFITWFFGAAILGNISDTIGRKKAMIICLAGSFVGYLLSAFAFWTHSIWLLLIGRIIYGFTAGSQPIAQAAIADVSTAEDKSKNMGFILLAISLGTMAGPIIGGVLSDQNLVSWFKDSTPLYFACILTLLNILYLWAFFRETKKASDKLQIDIKGPINIFIAAFKDKAVRSLSICFVFLQTGWSIYYLYITMFLARKYNLGPATIGLFFALIGFGLTIGFGFIVKRLANYSIKKIIAWGYGILALSMLITLVPNEVMPWLMVIPGTASVGTGYAFVLTLFSNQVTEDRQGWVMGVTGALIAFSAGIATLIAVSVTDLYVGLPIVVGAISIVIGALLIIRRRFNQP